MNGFKVVPKNEDDEMCNIYLVKSLPLVKKANFSIAGNIIISNFYRFLWITKYHKLEFRLRQGKVYE